MISSKKCQLFRKELQDIDDTILLRTGDTALSHEEVD